MTQLKKFFDFAKTSKTYVQILFFSDKFACGLYFKLSKILCTLKHHEFPWILDKVSRDPNSSSEFQGLFLLSLLSHKLP